RPDGLRADDRRRGSSRHPHATSAAAGAAGSSAAADPAAPVPEPLALRVNRAIDRGVEHLRRHVPDMPPNARYEGLLGLTLLACGVPAEDPDVQRIAASLRGQAPHLGGTYELSCAVFFFDRLGTTFDRGLIQTFALRLAAGQNAGGDWG